MGLRFVGGDREQSFLMPPDVREWLPENHLAWFVLAAVEEMDLEGFYAAYRSDGRSRPAYEPAMMVGLLLYAYARGIRSSRVIERACVEDVAFRVVAAQQRPDHATIARFIERHEAALAGLFGEVLLLCARSGLAKVGVIAIDATKVQANASRDANVDYEQLAREIIEEAKATDAAEDELYGDARGDELPEELATGQGRRAWLREAKRRLERQRDEQPQPVPRSRPKRVKEAKRRLEEELFSETRANAAYEQYRARDRMRNGRRLGAHSPPKPYTPPATPEGRVNTTDPDSHVVKGLRGFIQGYNAQAVTNEHQIVLAAEVMAAGGDFGHLEPMLDATRRELDAVGVDDAPEVVLADAGYWHQQQMERAIAQGSQVLIPPDTSKRKTPRPGWTGGYYAFMRRVLAGERGGELYRRRQPMIEPVFGQTKHNRGMARFHRRGRAAVRAEWRLITATHNLLKLHRHALATA
ncbi:MAG TPA: transposase [Actinomycetes bacterium]